MKLNLNFIKKIKIWRFNAINKKIKSFILRCENEKKLSTLLVN